MLMHSNIKQSIKENIINRQKNDNQGRAPHSNESYHKEWHHRASSNEGSHESLSEAGRKGGVARPAQTSQASSTGFHSRSDQGSKSGSSSRNEGNQAGSRSRSNQGSRQRSGQSDEGED